MGVTYRFDAAKYVEVMTKGVDAGLIESMKRLGAEIKIMLSQPGGGRVYVRKSKAKSAALGLNKDALKLGLSTGKLKGLVIARRGGPAYGYQARFAYLTRNDAAAMLRARRARGLKNRNMLSLGFHKASAPGQPPAPLTGDLRKSWQVGFSGARPTTSGTRRVIRAGSNKPYARRLEYGGGALAARPYIAPAMAKIAPTVRPLIAARVAEALRAAGFSGWNVAGVAMANRFGGKK